jgi:peptide/nickel transport system ATP-binding protein
MTNAPLLQLEDLRVEFATRAHPVVAVDGVSFSIPAGGVLGLVGESGSGKSMTANAIMRLIDPPGRITAGRILFKGQDLLALDEEAMRRLRGDRIAMVFQDPMMTLNPVLTVATQMVEAIHAHRRAGRQEALDEARLALEKVGIINAGERLFAYPHQFSGGMRQRVAIAIAMLNKPDLIICDEPTTALDVTTQAQILAEMQALCRESGTALLWITHDLAVVSGLAEELCVMRQGQVVERGPTADVLQAPRHPYTRQLLNAIPSRHRPGERLSANGGAALAQGAPHAGKPDAGDYRAGGHDV